MMEGSGRQVEGQRIRTVGLVAAVGVLIITGAFLLPRQTQSNEILVSAASSLTDVMKEIGIAFTRANYGAKVRFNFASSGTLQQQIEQGAPVDVFASASLKEMDTLDRKSRIERDSRILFAGNRLALIAPLHTRLKCWDDVARPWAGRLAISNPDSVPSGRFARQILNHRNLWTAVHSRLVFGENVRQTLNYVANGDVDAGVVFQTDARLEEKRVRVIDLGVPGKDHAPVVYPAAVITGAPHASTARSFVSFLRGPMAAGILARHGFLSVPTEAVIDRDKRS